MPALPSPRAALLLVSMLVAACGGATRVAYDNADVAVLVMADRYLEAARKVRADPAPALGGDEVSLRGKICAPGQFLPC